MPRASIKGNTLHDRTLSIDEEMGGHPHARQIRKPRMRGYIQTVRKQSLWQTGTELPRRQADAVNNHQFHTLADTPRVRIG